MDPAFYPFIILVTLATLNELTSFLVIRSGHSNAINNNIYSLLESFLFTWQFYRWGLFPRQRPFFLLLVLFLTVWITENAFLSSITHFNSIFNIVYGFINVLMSITLINRLVITSPSRLFSKPVLLICVCIAIFYTYTSLVEIYWIWGLDASRKFRLNIYRILYYINLLANLAYALAILWIPRKREFIVLS